MLDTLFVQERLPVYCTTSRPDVAKVGITYSNILPQFSSVCAISMKALGFAGAKLTCPFGPSEGDRGFEKNVKFFKEARESVGENFPLM